MLGPEHPSTQASTDSLVAVLQTKGKVSEVAKILHEKLERQRRVLGAEHLSTRASAASLAKVK